MAASVVGVQWLQAFVRDQPISQLTETLRGSTGGHFDTANLIVGLAWCVGLLVACSTVAIRL